MELADLNARATHETEGGVPEEPEAPEAQHVGDFLGAEAPVLERMGISVRDLGGGWSAAHLPIDRNANHHGTMHSGALFCAGELLSATVLASSFALEDCVPMIKNMAIEHHRPARSDVTATAYLDPQQAARMQRDLDASRRAEWVFAAELRDSDGHSVATMKGDCQLRLRTGGARRALTPSE